ncbi:MAG: DUF4867 family protein [Firmicutes bacterium]|nr:DUF4867 family protein [Bacillota bacterium]
MEIISVTDPRFSRYGQILEGYATGEMMQALQRVTPLPDSGVEYVAGVPELEALPLAAELRDRAFGGMPVEIGFCNGVNDTMNCLEYHRDSELNLGATDFILLLGKREDMKGGRLDTSTVRAFFVPAGVLIEVYATTLHYAPCSARKGQGFRVMIGLPAGTNLEMPAIEVKSGEDALLRARNKWLLAHADSREAREGAAVRLDGENVCIRDLI